MIVVRQIQACDVKTVVESVVVKCGELPYYTTLSPKLATFTAAWPRMMQAGTAVFLASIEGTAFTGFLAGLIVPDLLSGDLQGLEYLWLVAPEFRRDGTALRLLREFERIAKHQGCKVLICGSSAGSRPAPMRRMYRRLGYVSHAEIFRKEF